MLSNLAMPGQVQPFWDRFVTASGLASEEATARFYEVFHFDDNESDANQLAALVLNGQKRATAGLLWTNTENDKPVPKPGDLSVVTLWNGQPVCIIETIQVEIVPFDEVSDAFAATEGEGDKSLRYWKEAHWSYFSRECERIGREPSLQMPVICETFQMLYSG
jgi:uncharacterized protein YhfF